MGRIALLCWETGTGLGHVASLVQAARALEARGWSPIFAIPPGENAKGALPPEATVRDAPLWRAALPADFVQTGSSASMADMLADTGMRSAAATKTQIVGWHLVFASFAPDIVVADHAPGALLASRGRIPAVAVGTGYSVPPRGLPRFPPLHTLAPILDDEDAILATANAVLATFGSPPLAHLSDALTGDAALACTLPLLDPYAKWRSEPVLGPLLAGPVTRQPKGAGDQIVCYFQPGKKRQRLAKLAEALSALPLPCLAFVPGLGASEEKLFAAAGIVARPAALGADLMTRARLLVHAGGHGLAAGAALAGVPQVVLHYDIEKELTGRALAGRGVARRASFDAASAAAIHEIVAAAALDDDMSAAASDVAEENAAYLKLDAAERVADHCEALAG